MRRVVLLLTAVCLIGLAQADLSLTNAGFEADASQTSNVTDWYDTVTDNTNNWWETTWAGPTVSPNGTSVLGLSYMNTTTNWAYQSIGFNTAGLTSLAVKYDVGSFTDANQNRDLGVKVSIYESDGSFTPADNTDIDGASGITVVASNSTLYPLVAKGTMLENQVVTLDISSAGSGELFLRFENYAGANGEPWTAIDNVELVMPDYATQPDPSSGGVDVSVDLSDSKIAGNFSWVAPSDPNIVEIKGYDIYVDPNEAKVTNRDGSCLVAQTDLSVTQLDPASDFDYLTEYFWTVDVHYTSNTDPNVGTVDETIFTGSPASLWSFTTISAAPVIQSFGSVVVTESMLPASVSAVVADADGDLAGALIELLSDDVDYPNPETYTFTPNVTNPYAPSFTFSADTPGYYKFRLTVNDGTSTKEQIAEVAIFADEEACDAAQFGPSWGGFDTMDFDEDCDVDLEDFAEFARQWLKDTSLQAPDNYNWNIPYTPVVNGIINGNFETGTLDGFWTSGDDVAITDVDPIEGLYSAAWTVDKSSGNENGDGIATYFKVKADTSYTVSVQISGGSDGANDEFLVRRKQAVGTYIAKATWTPTTPPAVQMVTISFTTGPDDEGRELELVIFGTQDDVSYKVDDFQLSKDIE